MCSWDGCVYLNVQERKASIKETSHGSEELEAQIEPYNFGPRILLSNRQRKGVTIFARVTEPKYEGKSELLLHD